MPYYARVINGAVAEPAIELPEGIAIEDAFHPDFVKQMVACPSNVGTGWRYDGKTFTAPSPLEAQPVDLDALKRSLKKQVDDDAEALRLTLITPGSGQAMEYQEAYAQAQAALAATGTVKPADYPMLAATIGVDIDPDTDKPAKDVLGVARSVKAAYEAYLQAGAAIRGARLLGKAEIDAAADTATALAVFAAVKWPALG